MSYRRAHLARHSFELLLAVLALGAGLTFYLTGATADTAVGRAVHPFDHAWSLAFTASAVCIVYGLARPAQSTEAFGLVLLIAAVVANGAAILIVHGLPGVAAVYAHAACVLACLPRIHDLTTSRP